MKKALTLLLAVCMIATLFVVPVSAEAGPDQTLADVKASGTEYLQLTHANVVDYRLEPGVPPMPGDHGQIQIGGVDYPQDDTCFINVAGTGADYASQTPGFVYWELGEKASEYNVFQCLFGKSTAYTHGGGAKVQLVVYACIGWDADNGVGVQQIEIARSPFVGQGDAAIRVAGLIPENADGIKVECWSETGNMGACTSDIVEGVVYKADATYVPNTTAQVNMLAYTNETASATAYRSIPVDAFIISSGDVFCYDVMLSGDVACMGSLCVDGFGHMRDHGTAGVGLPDQNGVGSHANVDISDYADNQWYHREFTFTDNYNGTVNQLLVSVEGKSETNIGTAYYKNIYVKSADGEILWTFDPATIDMSTVGNYTQDEVPVILSTSSGAAVVPATARGAFPPPETTEPPTSETEPTDPPASGTTDGDESDDKATGTGDAGTVGGGTTEEPKEGCGSAITAGALVLAAICAAPIALKKRK